MSIRYPVDPNSLDSHQSNPQWLAAIIRFKDFRTQDREKVLRVVDPGLNVSTEEATADPVHEKPALLLSSQIESWSTQESKQSPTSCAVFTLAPVAPFAHLIRAGDWILFWAFNNTEDYNRVRQSVESILEDKPAKAPNEFGDGLRFVGRCNSPKRDAMVDPGTGVHRTVFTLTAVGFGEFTSDVYYTPAFAALQKDLENNLPGQLATMSENLDEALDHLQMTTNEFTRFWLGTFLGRGPSNNLSAPTGEDSSLDNKDTVVLSPNDTLLVPTTVAKLLNVSTEPNGSVTYFDILHRFVGIQGPGSGGDSISRMVPGNVDAVSGKYILSSVVFDTKVWSLLSQFSNAPINEMFTSLRVGRDRHVRPSFMLRQIPYSSKLAATEASSDLFRITAFSELPRWVISPKLVVKELLGPSDSLHYNFIQISGIQYIGNDPISSTSAALIEAPPIADVADIRRSGLKKYATMLSSLLVEPEDNNTKTTIGERYTSFLADIFFNQHYKWNGSIMMHGSQLPIAIGDNVEYRGAIYQLEALNHQGGVDPTSGRRFWRQNLQVSNGISTLTDQSDDDVYPHEEVSDPQTAEPTSANSLTFADTFITSGRTRDGVVFESSKGDGLGEGDTLLRLSQAEALED